MAESISDVTNQPILAIINGKEHRFRRLTVAEMFGRFEAEVIADWSRRNHITTAGMAKEERIDFLSFQASHPLSTEDSARLVRDKINSVQGMGLILEITHLKEGSSDTLPEILSLILDPEQQLIIKNLAEKITSVDTVKETGAESPKAKP